MTIDFGENEVTLSAGKMLVIPKDVEHKPVAREEYQVLLVETCGVINTEDESSGLTAENDVWI